MPPKPRGAAWLSVSVKRVGHASRPTIEYKIDEAA